MSVATVVAVTIAVFVPSRGDTSAAPCRCAGITDTAVLVARAREAVGSATHGLTSFAAKGPARPPKPTVEPEVREIAAILPDRYVEFQRQTTQPVTYVSGFNGTTLLTDIRGPIVWSPSPSTPEALKYVRQRLALLLQGWFLLSLRGDEETLWYSGEVIYRDRPAILLAFVDSPLWLRRVWLDRASCVPLAVAYERWQGLKVEPDPVASAPGFVRLEDVFSDRQMTSGFLVPYHVQRFDRVGRLIYDWYFEHVEVNGNVDPELFRPPRR